jgi:carbonic anhydrase
MGPKSFIKKDILAGFVVFIIAVPLSLGIALASQMPPVSALVAAVIGGLIVGAISGAPLVVSGPAAGLSAMVMGYVQEYGLSGMYQITILCGVIQILLSLGRLGRFIALIPNPILEGVLSAIGFTILLGQLHILLGQEIPGKTFVNILAIPHSISQASSYLPPFLCGLLALGIQLLWPRLFPSLRWFPGALPAVLLGTLAAMSFPMARVELGDIFSHMQDGISSFSLTNQWGLLFIPAFGMALVASAESLLTARAIQVLADKKKLPYRTHMDQELLAQGLGNLCSGVCGGMPITGVMVRSAANIESGALTRVSTLVHGGLIILAAVFVPHFFKMIPLSVLASILVLIGWRLLNLFELIHILRNSPKTIYLWPLTSLAILATDFLNGFLFAIGFWLVGLGFSYMRGRAL